MGQILGWVFVAAVCLGIAGCGDTTVSLRAEYDENTKKVDETLATITDKASAEAAVVKFREYAKNLEALAARYEKVDVLLDRSAPTDQETSDNAARGKRWDTLCRNREYGMMLQKSRMELSSAFTKMDEARFASHMRAKNKANK
jgi:hypothetical protein